jgi:tRNA-Thr(GGU) m(6)t(6)A37 methyltransferase TsaA
MIAIADQTLQPIGVVESSLTDPADAPRQVHPEAPEAWLVIAPQFAEGLAGVTVGSDVLLLTWLDRADRGVLSVHPQRNPDNPLTGVFATRSPHRPNPIGIHRVHVVQIDRCRLRVRNLEALNGAPILDLKPVLNADDG